MPKNLNPCGRLLLLTGALLLSLTRLAFSSTVVVGTCVALPSYPDIQTAVNSVPAGSTIKICPGSYAQQVTITKSLTLIGVAANGLTGSAAIGANDPVITSPSGGVVQNASDLFDGSAIAAQIFVQTPSGKSQVTVNVNNLIVDGSNNGIGGCEPPNIVGIYYQNASGTINHVATRFQYLGSTISGCQGGLGIFVESGYGTGGTAAVTIENSSVHDYDKNGITVDGTGTTATISGNYVAGVGATTVTAQNGIQVSDSAIAKVTGNTVTDDVYVNPNPCYAYPMTPTCYSASGILLYDTGGSMTHGLTISGNTVSNTQGAVVSFGDSGGTADYNTVTSNKVMASPAAGIFLIDGIDLCSNNNTATSNTVFNSSGSGVHIDSSCTESTGPSGNGTMVTNNTVNEACAGVLTGNGTGNNVSGTTTFNVLQTTFTGDSCPVSNTTGSVRRPGAGRPKVSPLRHRS